MPLRLKLSRRDFDRAVSGCHFIEMRGAEIVSFEDRLRGKRYVVRSSGSDGVEVEVEDAMDLERGKQPVS